MANDACVRVRVWKISVDVYNKNEKRNKRQKNYARNSKTLVKRVICRKIWEEQKKRKTFDVLR